MVITAKTSLYAIIGDPVDHSLSPQMHNVSFKALGLDCVYMAFRVSSNDLERAVEGIKSLGILGFNVTVPHKVAILKFLDNVEMKTAEIGAVNTVVNEQGKLIGYNTDGAGALKALIEEGADPTEKKVVLLGGGGAARSIAFYLAPIVKSLVVLNRTETKAKRLSVNLSECFKTQIEGKKLSQRNLSKELLDSDILINATSVGMYSYSDRTLVDSRFLRPDMAVFDIVYNPMETLLLREASKVGAKTINGVKMLVYQGALAFELWTGRKAPIDVMLRTVIEGLMKGEL